MKLVPRIIEGFWCLLCFALIMAVLWFFFFVLLAPEPTSPAKRERPSELAYDAPDPIEFVPDDCGTALRFDTGTWTCDNQGKWIVCRGIEPEQETRPCDSEVCFDRVRAACP